MNQPTVGRGSQGENSVRSQMEFFLEGGKKYGSHGGTLLRILEGQFKDKEGGSFESRRNQLVF